MPPTTHRHVVGDDDLAAALRGLSQEMRDAVLKAGVEGIVKPILVAAKRYARRSRDTGALEASLTTKVINYPASGRAVGLVGPDRNYYHKGKAVKGVLSRVLARNQRRPANYAHLVEFGHVAVKPERGATLRMPKKRKPGRVYKAAQAVGFVPAKPFLRPAVATTTAQQTEGFYRGLERGWKRAVDRQVASGRHVRG